jgi:hypothetical protein
MDFKLHGGEDLEQPTQSEEEGHWVTVARMWRGKPQWEGAEWLRGGR